jgi:hypothetical protein
MIMMRMCALGPTGELDCWDAVLVLTQAVA